MQHRLDLLCPDVQRNILNFVGFPGLTGYHSVSKSAHTICNSEPLWKAIYQRDYPMIPRRCDSSKTDYLRTYWILHTFAKDFVMKFSMGNPRYVSREEQARGVIELIKKYFSELDSEILRKWQRYANLTDDEFKEQSGGDGIHEYDEQLGSEVNDIGHDLLNIMLSLDESTLGWSNTFDWSETTIDYEPYILEVIKKLLMRRTSEGTTKSEENIEDEETKDDDD